MFENLNFFWYYGCFFFILLICFYFNLKVTCLGRYQDLWDADVDGRYVRAIPDERVVVNWYNTFMEHGSVEPPHVPRERPPTEFDEDIRARYY